MAMTTLEAAGWWCGKQFHPVPVPPRNKGTTATGWNKLRITTANVGDYFNGDPMNIGLLMGLPLNLTDEDDDCVEVKWARIEYAFDTGINWGRPGNPNSHHLYYTEPAAETIKYLDPILEKETPGDACLIELRCRTKSGEIGLMTIAPPSIHPTGEPYEFSGSPSLPATVSGPLLGARTRLIAAAALLGRHAKEGLRHEIFIALAGAFVRARWALEDAQKFIRAVYRVIWHETANLAQANADAKSTYEKFSAQGETTGLLKLASLIDERVFKKLKEWLDLKGQDQWLHNQPAPRKEPRVLPRSEPIESLRTRQIAAPQWLIEDLIKVPSVSLLVSPPKVGKTVLAVQFAMSIANGLHLFDNYRVTQAPVLFVEWDDQQGASSLKTFLEKCRASRPDMPFFFVTRPEEEFTIGDAEFRPWLVAEIQKAGARLCVLDSLTALRGFGSDDKTKSVVKLDAAEITLLGEISIETACAIKVIHHDSKTAAGLDTFSRAAGTYALQACSEAQIVLGRFKDLAINDPTRLLSIRGRHMRGLEAILRFKEETLDFDFLFDGDAASKYVELRQLLHILRGKTFDAQEAMKATGWQKTKIYGLLALFVSAGILLKDNACWGWNPSWTKTLETI